MLPTAIAKDTVTRLRPVFISARGTKERSWENADELEIGKCSFQATGTLSDFTNGYHTQTDATLYAPADSDIVANDRIVYEGITYEVLGETLKKIGVTGGLSHKVISLVRYKG